MKEVKQNILETLDRLGIRPDRSFMYTLDRLADDMPHVEPGEMPSTGLGASIESPCHGALVGVGINCNTTGWFYTLDIGAVIPNTIVLCMPARQPGSDIQGEPAALSLALDERADRISGTRLHVRDRGMDEADLLQPQNITIRCPDRTNLRISARSVSLFCFDGVVRGVFVRRPMCPVSFKEASADLLKTAASLQINFDAALRNDMSRWWPADAPDRGDGRTDYKTGINDLVHGLHIDFCLSPDPAGGWFYEMILYGDPAGEIGMVPTTRPSISSPASASALP